MSMIMLFQYWQKIRDGGLRFTYDQWRQALLRNKNVRILKGLQFGMLDEDNDGEVSLGDITRAVFRRASERDRARIRRFLEVSFDDAVFGVFKQRSQRDILSIFTTLLRDRTAGYLIFSHPQPTLGEKTRPLPPPEADGIRHSLLQVRSMESNTVHPRPTSKYSCGLALRYVPVQEL